MKTLIAIIFSILFVSSAKAQTIQYTVTFDSTLINNPDVTIYEGGQARSMRDYIYPELSQGQIQTEDYVLINGVSEMYEFLFCEEDEEISFVNVKKMLNILDSTECKPVADNYDFTKIDNNSKFLIYKGTNLYFCENKKIRKMKNDEILDPYGKQYDMRIIVKK